MVAPLRCHVDAGLGIAIVRVSERVSIGVVVGCKLRFDIRQRDISAHAYVSACSDFWKVQIHIHHHRVVAILIANGTVRFGIVQQLLTEVAFGRGEAIIQPIEVRKPESPVEVICLDGVRGALEIKGGLINLKRVRHL